MRKSTSFIALAFVVTLLLNSCIMTKHSHQNVPPGQMKKLTGSQSAKPYAPGQGKKSH